MNNVRKILEDAYQLAESGDDTHPELSEPQQKWVETIVEKAESQKAVLAVLVTSLTKKIETPTQDVRYHKKELPNGYSGRGFDTQHVTPFIREKFQRFAMKGGSGWLTRSLEQVHPYTLGYQGSIRDKVIKEAFLRILHDIEENRADPQKYLLATFASLIKLMERSTVNLDLLEMAEAVEIKHNIRISSTLVRDAYQKFAETQVCRYYLLTTAEPNVDDTDQIDLLVRQIHTRYGCEVIVNGILPSLKYYLRLLSNPKLFLECYSKNLQLDFNQNTDIKETHLRQWKELLKSLL